MTDGCIITGGNTHNPFYLMVAAMCGQPATIGQSGFFMDTQLHQLAIELQEALDSLRDADSKQDETGVYRIKKELTDLLEQFGYTVTKTKGIYCIEKLVGGKG